MTAEIMQKRKPPAAAFFFVRGAPMLITPIDASPVVEDLLIAVAGVPQGHLLFTAQFLLQF
ncbi:hypothetical protein [Pantoea stewartii]|uniref:hypothetical protein n=1 Tax=Pantoea stewartii TaxID=66269 RepID=UPI0025A23CB0|nr:hypothetical protein [Pantoea stewartii]